MFEFGETPANSFQGDKPPGKYMVCASGYPIVTASTFAEAAARALDLPGSSLDDELSIYEVETGIHFDAPHSFGAFLAVWDSPSG